ncbi:MAG: glycoside hydrolase family 3 C-terminal domain-containing protein [Vallitaleaceae bacterium]|jgi:beta-glucosidase|nr:glycoside hydrolase family 3 C-terminal domain-containing protein [Vallitaleaceae bacterium]
MKYTKAYRMKWDEKANSIVQKLSLKEKVSLMGGTMTFQEEMDNMVTDPSKHYNYKPYLAGGLAAYDVPPMLFCDGPRGLVCGNGETTSFPVSMLRGASFDNELEVKIGQAIGKEIRAYGGNYFGGVCINLPYNPGWGRSQETYGEESFHLGAMGSALVKGIQEEDVIACIKHYAFNQMENARFEVSVECDKRTEREVYLSHFKTCIDAGAGSVMSSYNRYQGTYCGHHDYLLNEVLKDEWGFDGFVISDFYWGIKDTVEAANGGQNIEMAHTSFFGDQLIKAVKEGLVSESKIDDAAHRIIRTLMAFNGEEHTENRAVLACDEHVALALESARKGITLLKNEGSVLPLDAETTKNILVVGELAKADITGDQGSSWVRPPYLVTVLEGISKVNELTRVTFDDGKDIEKTKQLAADNDAVVFVVGYNHDDEGEYVPFDDAEGHSGSMGGDRRESLGLHDKDIELIKTVGPINEQSIVVLIGGNTIMMTEWEADVSGIIMAYYPGMEGGRAIAEILYGKVNPSGKLPYVIPYKETDLPQVDWHATVQHYDYYHGYAKLEKEGVKPLRPYGFGLSYTTFDITDAKFNVEDGDLKASCTVKNTGSLGGTEVVQLYVGFGESAIDRPVKLLRGFTRVELNPGETATAVITCPIESLSYYNEEMNQMMVESMTYEAYIGSSSDNSDLIKGSFVL